MIKRDEEIGSLRTKLKSAGEEADSKDGEISGLKEEVERLKGSRETLEKTLEGEKAAALQEISRGKASAIQTLQAEMEERQKEALEQLDGKIREEMRVALEAADREKEVGTGKTLSSREQA